MPILMISARDAADDIDAALASGVTDHLAKPFRLGELFAKVDALTGGAP
jgi:DNA-binding response OmpR family regulator